MDNLLFAIWPSAKIAEDGTVIPRATLVQVRPDRPPDGGRFAMESVAAFPWNGWPDWRGIDGQIAVESVAALAWNWWPLCRGIRSMAKYRFEVDRFLKNFPQYENHFNNHTFRELDSAVLVSEAAERVAEIFDVGLSFHAPGAILSDLHALGRPGLPPLTQLVDGYMSPMAKGSGEFYIALNAVEEKKICLVSTLIHELGHYVEERNRHEKRQDFSSAMETAIEIIFTCYPAISADELLLISDEWVAWLNSIWIAQVLNIDTAHVYLGMILDETCWPKIPSEPLFVTNKIDRLVGYVASKKRIRKAKDSDAAMCGKINQATTGFLELLLLGMRRL